MDKVTTTRLGKAKPKVEAEVTVHAFQVPGTQEVLFVYGDGKGAGKKLPGGVTRKGNTLEFDDVEGTIGISLENHTSDFKLEFRTADPIRSKEGTDCPTTEAGDSCLPVVSCDKHRLCISNDGDHDECSYSLWFVDRKSGKDMSFDPIIKNIG